ncbi:MAG: hypothetical protein JWP01_344 [Myxococcales bacterium]|nr:hypothetical protein [Myxococcales bacterium]
MYRLVIMFVSVVGLVVGGCTSFDSLDRGVCGNGLLEAGEDCDSDDASCVRCAVVCTGATDCPTTDYTCGVDGLCHAPGGALGGPVAGGPFQVNDLAITDIDDDDIGDVVGVSRTSIAVHYGEPTARLTRVDSLITPSQTGRAAFGDLDNDAALDVTIVTADGMVAYGSRYGALAPIAVRSAIVEGAARADIDIRHLFHIGALTLGAFLSDDMGKVRIAIVDFLGTSAFEAPCEARLGLIDASTFATASIDVYEVTPDNLVVSMVTTTTPKNLCVLALHRPFLAAWTITDITPANAGVLSRRPVLADLEGDADRCPGVVNNDGGAPSLRYWDGALSTVTGACTLQAVASPLGAALLPASGQASAVAIGRVPLVPAIATIASDLLVLSDGVYAFKPGANGGFGQLYASQRRLASVDHADLDGDGMIDGVLVPESEDDIDVFYRRPNAIVSLFPGYLVYRIDTASRVLATEIADYDGNDHLDIAYLEQLTGYQRLSIAYGTPDLLLPPRPISAFSSVYSFTSLGLADSDDVAGVTDDLAVLQPPSPGGVGSTLTILSGGVLRSMTPYFDPRSDEDPDAGGPLEAPTAITHLRGVVVGRFVDGTVAGNDRDPIAIAVDNRDPATTAPQLWRVIGTSAGPDATTTPGLATTGLADCGHGVGSGLCVRDAMYVAFPVSPTKDVAIAIDSASMPHAVSFDPGASGTIAATDLPALSSKLPAGSSVRSIHAADLDGDGAAELVVAAAPAGTGTGAILVCTMQNGLAQGCEDVVPAILEATRDSEQPATACVDAAPAHVSLRDPMSAVGGTDLVVVCRDAGSSIYRVHRGDTGTEVTVLARTRSQIGALRVGDVTGDGVDDVVGIEGDSGAQSLVVFPQCSSRTLSTCVRGQGGGS